MFINPLRLISTVANVENSKIQIEKNNISGHIRLALLFILHSSPFAGQTQMF